MTNRPWEVPPRPENERVDHLAVELGVHPLVALCLIQNGMEEKEVALRFLSPGLSQLHDPSLFKEMEAGCDRIWKAIEGKEKILIQGDYDADGVTATALLLDLFKLVGAQATWFIPNRLTEGFSFGPKVIKKIKDEGITLCITVDNGTSASAEAEELARLGCDLIITDHHEPGETLPRVTALINPKVPGSGYPFSGLAGVGVAFKLAWGVARRISGKEKVDDHFRDFLVGATQLVALGTVADVVPLVDENRAMVTKGLRAMSLSPSIGLKGLKELCKLENKNLTSWDIAFRLAPRINAAGRMGQTETALDLLLEKDPAQADILAGRLDKANKERQRVEKGILNEAINQLDTNKELLETPVLVLSSPNWSPGVVGIVASKLCEEHSKPVVLISSNKEGKGRGSARSTEGFPIHLAFQGADDLLLTHGGHARAAGLSLKMENLDLFRERLTEVAKTLSCPVPPLRTLGEVGLEEITTAGVQDLAKLSPHGQENPQPLFITKGVTVAGHPFTTGFGGRDLSFLVKKGDQTQTAVIRNGVKKKVKEIERGRVLSMAFSPRMSWRGATVELDIKDFKLDPPQ